VETESIEVMKAESKNPSEDLPYQEKNQYSTVYWLEQGTLYTKVKEGLDQKDRIKKMVDLWEEGDLKVAEK